MRQNTAVVLAFIFVAFLSGSFMSSCKKSGGSSSGKDSATFYFHLHTQIIDSTIGGNADGYDSNTTGSSSTNAWYIDGAGRRIELFVPQFYITGIMLTNANGSMYSIPNAILLKGLDSEDYYVAKVPVGTYTAAMFTVGITGADSVVSPSTMFITDGNAFPTQSTMWSGSDNYGMKITGAYDTTSAHTGTNPLPFSLTIPNGLTIQHPITLPTRGSSSYPAYIATSGSINYVHILCDYGQLLSYINLKTSNQTSVNPLIADTLANNLTNMFRYEQ
jgi:hypothetical protein